jgi:hypothetical protein
LPALVVGCTAVVVEVHLERRHVTKVLAHHVGKGQVHGQVTEPLN